MRRTPLVLIAGAVTALTVAGCSDTLSPTRATSTPAATRSFEASAPALSRGASRGPTLTIGRDAGSARVGVFTLSWSQDAIACVGDPCLPTDGPVKVYVQFKSQNGFHWVDFSPHVEFKPGSNVVLQTSVYRGIVLGLTRAGVSQSSPIWQVFNIRYAESIGDPGVVDAPTVIDFNTGVISRQVSHFSGYVVTSGITCDVNADSSCSQ